MRSSNGCVSSLAALIALSTLFATPCLGQTYDERNCQPIPGISQSDISGKQVVVVGSSKNEDALNGVMWSAMREAYERANLVMKLQLFPARRSIYMANAGRLDAELLRTPAIEDEQKSLIRVDVPVYWTNETPFYVDSKYAVKSYQELKNVPIAYKRGVFTWEERVGDFPLAVPVSTDEQGMSLLAADRIKVFLDNDLLGRRTIARLGLKNIITGKPFFRFSLYHYVHFSHADLVPRLEKSLRTMQRDGTLAAIQTVCENSFIVRSLARKN